jgi:hypothetical protein
MRRILLRFTPACLRAWAKTRFGRLERIPRESATQDTTNARSPQQSGATGRGWIGNLLPPP